MDKTILHKISINRSVQGLSLWINHDSTISCYYSVISKAKNEVKVISSQSFDGLEKISKIISRESPLHLSIDGRGILYRIINNSDEAPDIKEILPSARPSEFYVQSTKISDSKRLISIVRKEHIDAILSEFNLNDIYPQSVHLGPLIIVPYINLIRGHTISLPRYIIETENGLILSISRTEQNSSVRMLNIGEDKISSEYLFAFFSSLFGYLNTLYLDTWAS